MYNRPGEPTLEHILVIGGVAAGLSAASRARRLVPDARVTVLERGPAFGYGACGLPYFLSGQVPRLESLLAHPPEFFRERRQLELLSGHEALEIEPGRHRVRVRPPEGGERWLSYDCLVISTGASSRWRPPALRNVFAANTWEQAAALDAALRGGGLRRIAVVGGGYIGLEIAEALARRGGLAVTLIHAHAAPLRGFEPELAAPLTALLAAAGIEVRSGVRVTGLEGAAGGRVLALETTAGRIETDAVVNCAGLRPEAALAAAAGIALGRWGGIRVDERQQTNLPAIFAAGDCAESQSLVTGASTWIPLGAMANHQGRVAGANAAGRGPERFPGVLGTLAVTVCGQEWGRTGLTLAEARAAGFAAAAETVEARSQSAYLQPHPVRLELVYQPTTGKLLGCHLHGAAGTVAGRLATAATALAAGLTLEQIEHLDLPYAPALAPLYEPMLIAAHNALRKPQ